MNSLSDWQLFKNLLHLLALEEESPLQLTADAIFKA